MKKFILLLMKKWGKCESSGLHGASGNNWICTPLLYKGKYRGEEFENAVNTGSIFSMTLKEYIATDEFCKFLHGFSHHRLSGRALFRLKDIELVSIPLFLFK
jgi:hypothetical protein